MSRPDANKNEHTEPAVLDSAHVGDIQGGLGTIHVDDVGPRRGARRRLLTLLAIVGPGLIVMVGDNDAGAFSTYGQAGQNFGTRLVWTMLLLIPVLYISQEMVLRLGVVTGVGHARLILERFGKFWGAFSVIDLFILNALTIVTEFIGISLATGYLGLPKVPSVIVAAMIIIGAVSTGSFRRFEQICFVLVVGSLLLIPIYVLVHPPLGSIVHNAVVPGLPHGSSVSTSMLLIIGIVGTTVAPWQLFFQQSYIIDKRITPRFINYERADLWIGIAIVVIGAGMMIGFSAEAFGGTAGFGHFTDAAGIATGLASASSRLVGVLFAIALLNASTIGAAAVGLSTAYASADVLGATHSLHRSWRTAKGFYASYAGLMVVSATLVLLPGVPLGLLTEGVQTLAGVLLPSAVVFLLLLCNDRAVVGPWANGKAMNVLTSVIIWVLILLSVILTASVLFPNISGTEIEAVLVGGGAVGLVSGAVLLVRSARRSAETPAPAFSATARRDWRMAPLTLLEKPELSRGRKVGLIAMRVYLAVAFVLVVTKVILVAVAK
jgi:NRAMP (natural resistance-associated macrophage protein)-like metal ion transporter